MQKEPLFSFPTGIEKLAKETIEDILPDRSQLVFKSIYEMLSDVSDLVKRAMLDFLIAFLPLNCSCD